MDADKLHTDTSAAEKAKTKTSAKYLNTITDPEMESDHAIDCTLVWETAAVKAHREDANYTFHVIYNFKAMTMSTCWKQQKLWFNHCKDRDNKFQY